MQGAKEKLRKQEADEWKAERLRTEREKADKLTS